LLDSGHVLGNLVAYAPLEGFAAFPLCSFVDREVAELMGIEVGAEGPLAVVPLVPASRMDALDGAGGPGLRSSPFARRLQPEDGGLIAAMVSTTSVGRDEVRLSRLQGASGASAMLRKSKYQFSPGVEFSDDPPDLKGVLPMTIIRRRSTRALSGETIKLEDLARVLEYAYRADLVMDEWAVPRFFDATLLETWVVAQNVDGLTPGVYLYVPESRELRLVDSGDFRRETHYLALGQELAGMASAVVFHTCDLPVAVRRWGDRAYRLMHMDAGHLGERMNVAAIALGLGVSGIAGFLDEEVNSLLGIPAQEACVYITCLGMPAR
jgi:SagB-type dehydrogenase family enzyme